MSAAGRAAIAEAQRKRWAKQKASKPVQVTVVPPKTEPVRRYARVQKPPEMTALSRASIVLAPAPESI